MTVVHEAAGLGAIDEMVEDGRPVERGAAIRSGALLALRGWALTADRRPWTHVEVVVDGVAHPAIAQDLRPDRVAAAGPWAMRAGFLAHVRVESSTPVEVRIQGRNDGAFQPCGPASMLVMRPAAPIVEGREHWAFYVDGIRLGDAFTAPGDDGMLELAGGTVSLLELWAVPLARPNERVRLDAYRDGVRIPVAAGIARRDVMHSIDGMTTPFCAFQVPLTPPLRGDAALELIASTDDGSAHRFPPMRYRRAASAAPIVPIRTARYWGSIDEVSVAGKPQPEAAVVRIGSGDSLTLRGWAFAVDAAMLPDRIVVELGDGRSFAATTGLARPDVAADLGEDVAAMSGYSVTLDSLALPAGRNTCRVIAHDDRRAEESLIGRPFFLDVESH